MIDEKRLTMPDPTNEQINRRCAELMRFKSSHDLRDYEPATDLNAAVEFAEAMRDEKQIFEIWFGLEENPEIEVIPSIELETKGAFDTVENGNYARALCLAVLRAMGEEF